MKNYYVYYVDSGIEQVFRCSAEDADHAEEQFRDAYPDYGCDEIVDIEPYY